MCKIMLISNFKTLLKNKNSKSYAFTLNTIKDIVTKHNNDGFGFSMSSEKDIYYYRQLDTRADVSLNNINYDNDLFLPSEDVQTNINNFEYEFFKNINFAIFHGRTSTNGYSVEHCHPYYKLDENKKVIASMVHNGVIDIECESSYEKIAENCLTDNDTELLFNHYYDTGIKGLKDVSGYFAFYNLRYESSINQVICDIVRDDDAPQYCLKIDDCYILATKKDMIIELLTRFKLKNYINSIVPMKDNVFFRLDVNSDIIEKGTIKKHDFTRELSEKELLAFKDYKLKPGKKTSVKNYSDKYYYDDDDYYFNDAWEDDDMLNSYCIENIKKEN